MYYSENLVAWREPKFEKIFFELNKKQNKLKIRFIYEFKV